MKIRLEEGINSIYGKMLEELKSQTKEKEASCHRARKFDEEITKNVHTTKFKRKRMVEQIQETPPARKSSQPPVEKVTRYISKPSIVLKFRRFIQRMLEKLF